MVARRYPAFIRYRHAATVGLMFLSLIAAWCLWTATNGQTRAKQGEQKARLAETRALALSEEATQADCSAADKASSTGNGSEALAHLARAIHYAPQSTLAAEQAVALLNTWPVPPPLLVLSGHEDWVKSAQVSPDGALIVTISSEKARVWDSSTGALRDTLTGHGKMASAQFSPDSTRIVTATIDDTAQVWEASTGNLVTILAGHKHSVESARFSPDDGHILTGSIGGVARIWTILPASVGPPPEWFCDFLHYRGQKRLDADGVLVAIPHDDWLALGQKLRGILRTEAGRKTPYLETLRYFVKE